MTKKIKKTIFRLLVVGVMTLGAVYALKFIVTTWNYNEISSDISAIEEESAKYGWNSTHGLYYHRDIEKRERLIENSDIAKFLFYSGYSKTGKVLRVVVFIIMIIYLPTYVILSLCYIIYLILYWLNRYL